MNRWLLVTALWALSQLGSLARADAPLIHCTGTAGDGPGPRRYAYEVDSASFPMMAFRVGTNDLNSDHYTEILAPEGWDFAVEPVPMSHAHGVKTPHGKISTGPCRCLTQASLHWWTDRPEYAIESFVFGYNHPWPAEDVGWILTTRREGPLAAWFPFKEDWDSAVGVGGGPVHGPVPEPTTCMLFGLGSLALLPLVLRGRHRPPQHLGRP